ncbi:hypothetical protein TRV_04118 [Trichophyton verrucosum HKI 0517]|uniref:Uncharacterized protein n=1 Tax=Trichophyton verrucosum (strain HKI 0517) TaxID=663202 RepID=D4DAH1_TRIVH|nr:uncharacterized protein TRV_04118 [Trichophyton verrucosum HKI 0517]EFE41169.1 hypothetical protein TRV_04118 [Trichophyton verrucosum HKI 0517]
MWMDLDGRIKEFHAGHSPSFLGPSMPRLALVSRSPTIDSDMPNTKWRFRATGSSNPIQLQASPLLALDRPKLHPFFACFGNTRAISGILLFYFFDLWSLLLRNSSWFFFCRCELLLLLVARPPSPSSAATNCISRCIHARSRTSGYFLQPASQPDTRIRSPERRIERNSKKQKGSQKKEKKVNRDSARSSLIGPSHEQGVISASYHQGSQPRNRVEKPAGQLSCSSSSRCFFFGSSAFSSLVTAAAVRSTAAGAAALLYLYNCWFHGPARFSSMHLSSSRCMVAASTHACMPQQNPRKEQREDGPQSSTSQKWELTIRQPPFTSPPLKPMSIGIICLVWPLKPQGSIRFLSTPPAHHTLL